MTPFISLIAIDSDNLPLLDAEWGIEGVVVSTENSNKTWLHWRSNANPIRRINIGIGEASGEWVMLVPPGLTLLSNWHRHLFTLLSVAAENVGSIVLAPVDGTLPLLIARRRSFIYGPLDERYPKSGLAYADWIFRIYMSAQRRVFGLSQTCVHFSAWVSNCGAEFGIKYDKIDEVLPNLKALLESFVESDARNVEEGGGHYIPKSFWETKTEQYIRWEIYQPDEPEILSLVKEYVPKAVLELGAGAGRNIRYFDTADQYVGIDIARNLLGRAVDRIKQPSRSHLIVADASRLCFSPGQFDFIFSDSTLQHLTPSMMASAVKEIMAACCGRLALLEYVRELSLDNNWFAQSHIFSHPYIELFSPYARLVRHQRIAFPIQPAIKELFVFEKY